MRELGAAMLNTDLKQGFYLGDWEVQPLRGVVNGPSGPIHVEPLVMDVLIVLASRPGEVVERSELVDLVWQGRAMSDEPLNRCISQLRRAFDDSSRSHEIVETVPQRGYRLVAPVRPLADSVLPSKSRRPWLRISIVAATAVVAALLGMTYIMSGTGSRSASAPTVADNSIAVLPFENVGDDDSEDYFSDGLTEEIMNRLASVAGLTVAARTSSFAFKGSDEDARSIADKLGVALLLDGSIRKDGDRVRISAYLINRDGFEIWSATYEGVLTNVFALQDDISNTIVRQIAPELITEDDEPRIRTERPTHDMRAYDHVLQGRYHLARRGEEPLRRSIALFQEAITLDESYADAYVGLAAAYALLPFYSRETAESSFDLAMAIIEKGAQVSASVDSKASGILAFILYHSEWRWIEAESAFRKALQYTPNDAELLNWYSVFLAGVGRSEEALEVAIRAKDLDRLSPVINQRLAVTYLWTGNDELAAEYFDIANELGMAPAMQPEAYVILLLRQQEYDVARWLLIAQQKISGFDTEWVEALFMAIQEPEYLGEAVQAVLRAEESGDISALHLFGVWVYLDEVERAIDAALALIRDRVSFNTEFLFAKESSALRQHPRFGEVIRGIKLDHYWDYFGWPAMCQSQGTNIVCH
jgi:TolB-like protein/DNA-binding winged helix-turn-helix (wHTH) protein/tetratricopeptide (TPR) repeat protein